MKIMKKKQKLSIQKDEDITGSINNNHLNNSYRRNIDCLTGLTFITLSHLKCQTLKIVLPANTFGLSLNTKRKKTPPSKDNIKRGSSTLEHIQTSWTDSSNQYSPKSAGISSTAFLNSNYKKNTKHPSAPKISVPTCGYEKFLKSFKALGPAKIIPRVLKELSKEIDSCQHI